MLRHASCERRNMRTHPILQAGAFRMQHDGIMRTMLAGAAVLGLAPPVPPAGAPLTGSRGDTSVSTALLLRLK